MRTKAVLAAAIGLGLAACTPAAPPDIEMPTTEIGLESCGGDKLQHWVGLPWNETMAAQAGPNLRVITPGMAVTMDYSAERLNVELDDGGIVRVLSCG
ncbi:I78 family peptidase inhibitor [Aliigemmobacter aestuarii]|nr:I78 family peptidase inhibitor [Gemmobacter aestuarii]